MSPQISKRGHGAMKLQAWDLKPSQTPRQEKSQSVSKGVRWTVDAVANYSWEEW